MLKQLAKSTFALAGLRVSRIPRRYQFGVDAFSDAARILNRHDPLVFDVGANIGQSVDRLRRVFHQPRIHCFEPSSEPFRRLREMAGESVVLNQIGLADKPGTLELLENCDSVMTSFLEQDRQWGELRHKVSVPVSTIDAYCEAREIKHVDFLKIDTQGFDYQVLRGAENMLRRKAIKLALCEVNMGDLYKGVEPAHVLLAYMADCGYSLFGVYDQTWVDDRLSWADMMFIQG